MPEGREEVMKYRKISPCIWNDAKVRELSDKGKLALLFLLTHPHMTPLGAIRANGPGLACELGWSGKAFRKAFGEILALGIAKEDAKAPLVWFPNFLRHNMPESPNVVRSWVGAFGDLPESPLKRAMLERTAGIVLTLGEGFRNAFAEAFPGVAGARPQGIPQSPPGGFPEAFPGALPIPSGEAFPKGMPNQEQEQEQGRKAGRGVRACGAIRDAAPGAGGRRKGAGTDIPQADAAPGTGARRGKAGGAAGMPGGGFPDGDGGDGASPDGGFGEAPPDAFPEAFSGGAFPAPAGLSPDGRAARGGCAGPDGPGPDGLGAPGCAVPQGGAMPPAPPGPSAPSVLPGGRLSPAGRTVAGVMPPPGVLLPHGARPVPERPSPSVSPAGRALPETHPQRAAFLSCWEAYPVRQGEGDAWREWLRLWECRALPGPRAVREAIRLMLDEDTRWRRGKIPKMAKWLAGKGWNDRPFVEPQASPGAPFPRAGTAAQRRARDNDDMAKMLLHVRRAHAQSGFYAANAGQSGAALPAGGQDARAAADFGGGLGGGSGGVPV